MKKILSLLLSMVTVLCAFSGTTVFADDEYISYILANMRSIPFLQKLKMTDAADSIGLSAKKDNGAELAEKKRMLKLLKNLIVH